MAGNMRVLSLPVIAVEAQRGHGDHGARTVGYEICGLRGCAHPPRDIGLVSRAQCRRMARVSLSFRRRKDRAHVGVYSPSDEDGRWEM